MWCSNMIGWQHPPLKMNYGKAYTKKIFYYHIMTCGSKVFAFVLVLLIVLSSLSLFAAKLVNAQSETVPSVPKFKVQFVGTGFVPLTTDELPGVNITIVNQPFTPYTDKDGNEINLYYLIQWKPNSSSVWQEDELPLTQSNSSTTVLTLALIISGEPPPTGVVDFQVEAEIGYVTYEGISHGVYIPPTYIGQVSGWSNTQTVSIPSSSSSSSISSLLHGVFSLAIYLVVGMIAASIVILFVLLNERKKHLKKN